MTECERRLGFYSTRTFASCPWHGMAWHDLGYHVQPIRAGRHPGGYAYTTCPPRLALYKLAMKHANNNVTMRKPRQRQGRLLQHRVGLLACSLGTKEMSGGIFLHIHHAQTSITLGQGKKYPDTLSFRYCCCRHHRPPSSKHPSIYPSPKPSATEEDERGKVRKGCRPTGMGGESGGRGASTALYELLGQLMAVSDLT